MYYGTRAEDQEGCRKPEIVEGEGFKQFKIYKVECCYPPNYQGHIQCSSHYLVKDENDKKTVLGSHATLQDARDQAGQLFKEFENQDKNENT